MTLQRLSGRRDPPLLFFSDSKVTFRWTSIKCVHHDTPFLLVAVEFVMERFDWRPRKFYFRKWKNVVVESGSDDCCKGQIRHTENQTNCCITVKRLNWEYLARIQKRKKKTSLIDIWLKSNASILCSTEKDNVQISGLLLLDYRTQGLYYKKLTF